MEKKSVTIKIADTEIRCSFNYDDTASFFSRFIVDDVEDDSSLPFIEIDDYDRQLWLDKGNELNGYGEYSLLCGAISDYLMSHRCCLVHGVAFRYKDKAYLICASPGVGKSTQIKYLMDLYPGEFSVICGDRPCLKFNSDGSIFVYPTPWNGKENWYGAKECELAGVFYLSRGENSEITLLSDKAAILPIFVSIISRRETEEVIRYIGEYTEKIITHYPVYRYVNGGVPESTRYFYDTIFKEAGQ